MNVCVLWVRDFYTPTNTNERRETPIGAQRKQQNLGFWFFRGCVSLGPGCCGVRSGGGGVGAGRLVDHELKMHRAQPVGAVVSDVLGPSLALDVDQHPSCKINALISTKIKNNSYWIYRTEQWILILWYSKRPVQWNFIFFCILIYCWEFWNIFFIF